MKIAKISTLALGLGAMLLLSEAHAATLSISPTGSFDAQGDSIIKYDVYYNAQPGDGPVTYESWDFDMGWDTTELANPVISNVPAYSIVEVSAPGTINDSFFSLGSSTDVQFTPGNSYLLTSVSFDILQPPQVFDGQPDFWTVDQQGDILAGFLNNQGDIIQLGQANGADVGVRASVVPLPGAVWLLGAGLAGLAGLRKRVMA
ncbi:MAG: hypothetical protein M0P70_17990 [Desulfobulbaceae bacterium]|nr:hypothetical protein [Desulfobulbaceae bacterium]